MEIEYYSECCNAPPLYHVHHEPLATEKAILMGICMSCREHSEFEEWSEDENSKE